MIKSHYYAKNWYTLTASQFVSMSKQTETVSGFTPGPWIARALSGAYVIEGGNGQTVLLIGDDKRLIPMRSDAALITAAPDLLEACQSMLEWMEFTIPRLGNNTERMNWGGPIGKARDAIALATGKERDVPAITQNSE